MGREEDRIKKIMADMAKGNDYGHKLKFDPKTKTIRPVRESPLSGLTSDFDLSYLNKDPDGYINVAPSDADLFIIGV